MSAAPMPGAEGLAEPLRSRWSPSVFDDGHRLSVTEITTLLQAARWAPSHGNLQLWRYLVCERGDAAHAAMVPHLTRGNAGWVPRASVVLLAATQVAEDPDREPDEKPVDPALNLYCLGHASAHLTVQAHAMGLWAHQFQGIDKDGVSGAFGLPAHWRVIAGIAVGVRGNPAEVSERDQQREQRVRSRKPLIEIAYGAAWGEAWPPATLAP